MTGMILTHPFFLWLLPLAALPILFHLFARIRRKTLPFSTFMFFHRIDPRLNAMRQIRDWLILLLRVLALALFLLALARPVWLGVGSGGKTAAVLVIDNSGSMDVGGRSETKLQQAVEAAEAVAASLNSRDPAGVVLLVDDPSVVLPDGMTSDRMALKTALRQILPTEATGAPGEALRRALAMLETCQAVRFEVHVFSDFQETEWSKSTAGLKPPRSGTAILLHRIPSEPRREANVSVADVSVPEKRWVVGRRIPIAVRLSNATTINADVRINYEDDQGNKKVDRLTVPAREERVQTLFMSSETAGIHWERLWVENDGFKPDNRAAVALGCVDREAVLFAGAANEFGVLPVAMSPTADGTLSGLLPVFVPLGGLEKSLTDRKPVLVVTTWQSLGQGKADESWKTALDRHVRQGGNLLILPSASDAPSVGPIPDWVGGTVGEEQQVKAGLPALVFQKNVRLFDDLRDAKGDVLLRSLRAFRFRVLRLVDEKSGLAGLEDGRALLAGRQVGEGTVFLCGLAFDPSWSNLPLKAGFLAVAQSMALCAGGAQKVMKLTAGERSLLEGPSNAVVRIRSLASDVPMDWKGAGGHMPIFARSGVYVIENGPHQTYVAVNASARESREAYLSGKEVPAAGGLAYSMDNYRSANDLMAKLKRRRVGLDFYTPFVLACLLALVTEGWLASSPPKQGGRSQVSGISRE
jgi:hypothetical protein